MFDEGEFRALKRKEKRIAILTVVTFTIGISLTFGTYANFILSVTNDFDGAASDSVETSESLRGAVFVFGGFLVVGPLLLGAAFALAEWWSRVHYDRNRYVYASWME